MMGCEMRENGTSFLYAARADLSTVNGVMRSGGSKPCYERTLRQRVRAAAGGRTAFRG